MEQRLRESAIEGLMLLGYTKEEALRELEKNERKKQKEAELDWWRS